MVGIKITPRKPERRSPGKQQTGKSTTLGKSMLLPKKYKKVTPELAIKTDRIDNVYLEGQSEPRNIFEVREFDVEEIY